MERLPNAEAEIAGGPLSCLSQFTAPARLSLSWPFLFLFVSFTQGTLQPPYRVIIVLPILKLLDLFREYRREWEKLASTEGYSGKVTGNMPLYCTLKQHLSGVCTSRRNWLLSPASIRVFFRCVDSITDMCASSGLSFRFHQFLIQSVRSSHYAECWIHSLFDNDELWGWSGTDIVPENKAMCFAGIQC